MTKRPYSQTLRGLEDLRATDDLNTRKHQACEHIHKILREFDHPKDAFAVLSATFATLVLSVHPDDREGIMRLLPSVERDIKLLSEREAEAACDDPGAKMMDDFARRGANDDENPYE